MIIEREAQLIGVADIGGAKRIAAVALDMVKVLCYHCRIIYVMIIPNKGVEMDKKWFKVAFSIAKYALATVLGALGVSLADGCASAPVFFV